MASFLVLSIAGLTSRNAEIVRGAYLSMNVIGQFVIIPLSLAALMTGLVQSLGTHWGLFRHYWVFCEIRAGSRSDHSVADASIHGGRWSGAAHIGIRGWNRARSRPAWDSARRRCRFRHARAPGGHDVIGVQINPLVVDIARSQFYFVRECPAHLDIVMGDARLSLEREQPHNYDVLAVDAFSGDSIPVHLLTVEAFREYFRHLKPEGVLAVHVSDKYLQLAKVVAEAARALNKHAILINNDSEKERSIYTSDWVMLATDPNLFAMPQWIVADRDPLPDPVRREWTDDYSSILGILK